MKNKALIDALESARNALVDLGACDDQNCQDPNCNHALIKITRQIKRIYAKNPTHGTMTMEIPQDLKDYLDSVPIVTDDQAKQLADHVRALEMKHAAKKRWTAHQHGITNETESHENK